MFILLPLDKRLDWKNPPVVTIALILINCFIYFALQSGDDEIQQKAQNFYRESGLANMEFPIYKDYLLATKQFSKLQEFETTTDPLTKSSYTRSMLARYTAYYTDTDFAYNQSLLNNAIPNLNQSEIQRLKHKRLNYLEKYENSVIFNYSLRPAQPQFSGIYGHMFLHGSNGHLIGNMVFLAIVGFVVEAILGGWLFLVAYLLTGLCSAALDILLQSTSYNFHLGASGAISGVMGMYAALFGLRKIQFFYNFLFWVDRVKAPAIIMLLIWIFKEFSMMLFVQSNVNYLAHIGGLLSGALIAFLLTLSREKINTEYMDSSIKTDKFQKHMADASQYLGEMNSHKAKVHFLQALSVQPNNIEVLQNLVDIALQTNNNNEYQKHAVQLIESRIKQGDYENMYKSYQEFIKKTQTIPPLSDHGNFQVIKHLIGLKKYPQAEKLIISMFKKNHTHQQYSSLFLTLGKQRFTQGDKKGGLTFIKLILKYFPNSEEAKVAAQFEIS